MTVSYQEVGLFAATSATLAEAAEWDTDGPPADGDGDEPALPERQPPPFRCLLCASGSCTWHKRVT